MSSVSYKNHLENPNNYCPQSSEVTHVISYFTPVIFFEGKVEVNMGMSPLE